MKDFAATVIVIVVSVVAVSVLAGCTRAAPPALPDPSTLEAFDVEQARFEGWVQRTPVEERAAIMGSARTAVARYYVAAEAHLRSHDVALAANPAQWSVRLLPDPATDLGRLAEELSSNYRMSLVYDVGFFARSSPGAGAATSPDTLFCDHAAIREISGRTSSIAHEMEHVRTRDALRRGVPSLYQAFAFADFGWTNHVPVDELNAYDADVLRALGDGSREVDAAAVSGPANQGLVRANMLVELLPTFIAPDTKLATSLEKDASRLLRVSVSAAPSSDRVDLYFAGQLVPADTAIRHQLQSLTDLATAHRARFSLMMEIADQSADGMLPRPLAWALGKTLARKTGEPPPAWQASLDELKKDLAKQIAIIGRWRPGM